MEISTQSTINFVGDLKFLPAVESHITRQKRVLERLGGCYIRDYISESEEHNFLRHIDHAEICWITELKRRVQHYGYRYDYKARKISTDMRIGDLPQWILPLVNRLAGEFFDKYPEQMIINEYQPGHGIASHVDCEPCFGPVVVSVSLGSPCVMNLTKRDSFADSRYRIADAESERIELLLEPRSAVIFSGDCRYHWMHGIAAKKSDVINGYKHQRERRISLTFRTVTI